MSNISNAIINSQGSFYTPLNLKKDDKGNILNLAFDLDNNGKVNDNEIVTDGNKDGKITPNEILDFVVNMVKDIPKINYVQKTLVDNRTTLVGEALFNQYQDKLESQKNNITIDQQQAEISNTVIAFKKALADYSEQADALANKLLTLLGSTSETPYFTAQELINIDRISYTKDSYTLYFKPSMSKTIQDKKVPITEISFNLKTQEVKYLPAAAVQLLAADGKTYTFALAHYPHIVLDKTGKVSSGYFNDTGTLSIQGQLISIHGGGLENGEINYIKELATPVKLKDTVGNAYSFSGDIAFDKKGLVIYGSLSAQSVMFQEKSMEILSAFIEAGHIGSIKLAVPTLLKAFDGNMYTLDPNTMISTRIDINPMATDDLIFGGQLAKNSPAIIQGKQTILKAGIITWPSSDGSIQFEHDSPIEVKGIDGNTYMFEAGVLRFNSQGFIHSGKLTKPNKIIVQGQPVNIQSGEWHGWGSLAIILASPTKLKAMDNNIYTFEGLISIDYRDSTSKDFGLVSSGTFRDPDLYP